MSLRLHAVASAAAALVSLPAFAAEQVLVTGSVVERAVAEAPYAVGVVGRDALRDAGPMINLSEALAQVPGLVVSNRSNYAQDLQIGSRGFGARATFGVRGIRLYADGIPASGPDGQGQVSQFDLAGAERVEVLRGPFSVLYGNSSGGVIAVFTAPVRKDEAEGGIDVGSFGLRQLRGALATRLGDGLDLRLSASAMTIDGFRPQSGAERRLVNARLGWQRANDSVVVSAGFFSQPADDPLGLRRDQFDADPLQTTPEATQFDTRKDAAQRQLGATWRHRFGDAGALRDSQLTAYAGRRSITQYLAINNTTQGNPGTSRHGGAVIDFDRSFQGVEGRLRFGWTDVDLQLGVALDEQSDDRQGYENYRRGVTPIVYGVQGQLRRDEENRARSRDAYAQLEWTPGRDWTTSVGVRSGRTTLSSADRFFAAPNNGDDSGSVSYSYTNPVLGLRWQAVPGLNLHASLSRGHESPTLNEISYRVDNVPGLNLGLKAQTSRQAELGMKWRGGGWEFDAALFDIRTDDEIAVAANAGGRASFQNVGRTQRRGAEVAAGGALAAGLTARLALTWLDGTYRDDFTTCINLPCNAANPANLARAQAGNRIAGTQRQSGWAEVAWDAGAWGRFGAEWRAAGRTAANDTNLAFAPGWAVANLRWSLKLPAFTPAGRTELLMRVDNAFDRRYSGSVIVNESNLRFFEPGAPRSWLVALRVAGDL